MDVTGVAPVPGFDGYLVSEAGEVFSYWRPDGPNRPYRIREDMPVKRLKPREHSNGYLRVCLGAGNDKYIHRLVAEAFLGPIPEGFQVRHLDGDRKNNRSSNLAVGTQVENEADKLRHGTIPRGARHVNSVLTESEVCAAREAWQGGMDLGEIKRVFKIEASRSAIHSAVIGDTWKHLPGVTGKRKRLVWKSKGGCFEDVNKH